MSKQGSDSGSWIPFLLIVWCVLAWITHVAVCFKSASWGFLIAGALFFPVAIVHGTGIWFGFW
ncbi:hypothetical protein [Pseudomonas sp. B26(2017)]|uniref:hypothetical protein n=1 Tax=Pseudomonas sp. B26(2017) TaxID=1981732 RepID=UPI000A1EE521|nr:hypothetical protein [Pseudomonas sp. B26(2017)]